MSIFTKESIEIIERETGKTLKELVSENFLISGVGMDPYPEVKNGPNSFYLGIRAEFEEMKRDVLKLKIPKKRSKYNPLKYFK